MVRWHLRLSSCTGFPLLFVGLLAGCNKTPDPQQPSIAEVVPPATVRTVPPPATSEEEKDTRSRWIYSSGWFAQGNGAAWFEHNDEAIRLRGRAWEFTERKRTKEYVELFDASRGVSLRLTESLCDARWDKDGENAEWKPLYRGHWSKRE